MERIKKLILQFLDNCKRFYEWLKKRPRNVVIAVICFTVIIAVAILLIRFLPYIFTAGVILWAFGDDIKSFFQKLFGRFKLPNLENDSVCFEVTKFMHKTISEGKPLDEAVKTPSTVSDTYDINDYLNFYNGAPKLDLRLIRKNRDKNPERDFLKIGLQTSVNARLADGYLLGYIWAVPADDTIPLIKVAALDYCDLFVHIGILLTNNAKSVNAARISDMPTIFQVADDIDPLFMKEGD
jgi:hypothetical protein